MCIRQSQSPSLYLPTLPPGNHKLFFTYVTLVPHFKQAYGLDWTSLVALTVKNLPAVQETQV